MTEKRRMWKLSWMWCKHLNSDFFLPYYLVTGIICHFLVMSDTVGCHVGMFSYANMVFVGTSRASPAAHQTCPGPWGSPQPCLGPRTTEPPGPSALVQKCCCRGGFQLPTARSCPMGNSQGIPSGLSSQDMPWQFAAMFGWQISIQEHVKNNYDSWYAVHKGHVVAVLYLSLICKENKVEKIVGRFYSISLWNRHKGLVFYQNVLSWIPSRYVLKGKTPFPFTALQCKWWH